MTGGYEMKSELYIQSYGKETDTKKLLETAKEIWKADGNKIKDLHTIELYYKPEEGKCYYVLNGESSADNFFLV